MPNGAVIIEKQKDLYYIKTKIHDNWFYVDTQEVHDQAESIIVSIEPNERLGFPCSVPLNFLQTTAQRIYKILNASR